MDIRRGNLNFCTYTGKKTTLFIVKANYELTSVWNKNQ